MHALGRRFRSARGADSEQRTNRFRGHSADNAISNLY
jgi:hypothetical protein